MRISKSEAVNKMRASSGRRFTVTFNKNDGSIRTMNGSVRTGQFMSSQGYVLVREGGKNIRSVNPRTISALNIEGKKYQVG